MIQQLETADIEPEKEFLGKPPVRGPSPANRTPIPYMDIDGCPPCTKLSPPSFLGEACCVVHLVLIGKQTACWGGKQLQAWARLPDKWAHGPIRPLRFKTRFVNRLGEVFPYAAEGASAIRSASLTLDVSCRWDGCSILGLISAWTEEDVNTWKKVKRKEPQESELRLVCH